jgi:hypothetical protein
VNGEKLKRKKNQFEILKNLNIYYEPMYGAKMMDGMWLDHHKNENEGTKVEKEKGSKKNIYLQPSNIF